MSCGWCDSSTYDSSSVSCATPPSAMPWLASTCWSYLTFCPSLLAARIGEPRREARQHRFRRELVRRARVAVRERDVAGAARARRRTTGRRSAPPSGRGSSSRCRRRRARCRRSSASQRSERRLVDDGLVVSRHRRRRASRAGGSAAANLRSVLPRRFVRDAAGGVGRAASPPARSLIQLLNSKRWNSAFSRSASAPSMRRSSGATGSAQSVLTVRSRRPCGSQSRASRRFSPTTPGISAAWATMSSSVP